MKAIPALAAALCFASAMAYGAATVNTQGNNNTFTGTNAFTGTVTVPTRSQGDNSTKAASTAYVDAGLAGKVSTSSLPNTATLAKITEAAGNPLWNGGAWPGSVPTVFTDTTVSGAYNIDPAVAAVFALTLTGNTNFTISTPPSQASSFSLVLAQGGAGGYSVAMPGSASFGDAGTPDFSVMVGSKDIVNCLTVDVGASWQCSAATGF